MSVFYRTHEVFKMIEIILAGEPVGKGRPRFVKATGRAYTPEKTARYEDKIGWAAQAVMAGRPLMDKMLKVEIVAYLSIPVSKPKKWQVDALSGVIRPTKKPDIDNYVKGALDALNKVVWHDDGQVVEVLAQKFYSDRPRLEIRVDNLY